MEQSMDGGGVSMKEEKKKKRKKKKKSSTKGQGKRSPQVRRGKGKLKSTDTDDKYQEAVQRWAMYTTLRVQAKRL
ncbi:hypothetical protein SODALDRAFT_206294 [Sodiomyces alkalinus F11]|uniref:Uncharacterized protein n=1 Tax=Sodiomyces alkalinus (strain CBS 110278 / VKM F-3762 / F11) TaxID=1314773 RepID=A0A3N2PQF4_SODAK|nr:hypothetical protein SODALDRAFT_206294 [Sodiomyces alkalinus F11]ROT36743.1 hypothetical protein SODALDRAFT_206294 [Sodiomyces alkalinus F11]